MQINLIRRISAIGFLPAAIILAACAPVVVVPAEAPTPEAATQRAADPKAPGGALIIKKPDEVTPPASVPKQ
jgi:hypothetical protein